MAALAAQVIFHLPQRKTIAEVLAQFLERKARGVFAFSAVCAVVVRIIDVCEGCSLELGVLHRPTLTPVGCGLLLYNSYRVIARRALYKDMRADAAERLGGVPPRSFCQGSGPADGWGVGVHFGVSPSLGLRRSRSWNVEAETLGQPESKVAQWFREVRDPLRRFIAARRGIAPGELDDVAQEVFLRLLRYDRDELIIDPRGYLFKVAANIVSEWTMRAQRRFPHNASWLEDLPDSTNLAEDTALAQRNAILHRALGALPDRMRDILRLHFAEGLTHDAIAMRLGITRRIVKRDLISAYASLRLALPGLVDGLTEPRVTVTVKGGEES
jgi:RNA polymerase sigma factor (sigma-70 family)